MCGGGGAAHTHTHTTWMKWMEQNVLLDVRDETRAGNLCRDETQSVGALFLMVLV